MARPTRPLLVVAIELIAGLAAAGLAGGAAWLIWGAGVLPIATAAAVAGIAGLVLLALRRWLTGCLLLLLGLGLAVLVLVVVRTPTAAPPPPRSALLLPDVRPWPSGVVPICWLNRPDRGTATPDDLRMMLAVKGAQETWAAAGAVSFHDIGTCPASFHGVRLLIGRTIDDPDSPALGAALADQDRPVTVPFVFPSRGGCNSAGRFGGVDVCAEGEAVHELGHALGLPDIHYSQSAPDACKATLRQDRPALAIPYDPASVMNACNPDHLFGRLSPGDITAIQQIYGR